MTQSPLRGRGGDLVGGRAELRSPALVWAVVLGVLANALVRVPGRPGLNVALWAIAGVAVLALLVRHRPDPPSREARLLVGGALAFTLALVLRDAEALAMLSLLAAVLLLGLAAGRAASAWATHARVIDIVIAAARLAVLGAAGPLGWGRPAPGAAAETARWTQRAKTVARGTVMALPALLALGALLMSADPVFSSMIQNAFRIDLEPLIENLVFIGVMAWLTAGYLRAVLVDDAIAPGRLHLPRPAVPAAEVAVALWALNLLFIVFLMVQMRYLFGGAHLVEVTTGLSYAEYARRGFFELVAAAALVVPILLLADWATAPESARGPAVLRATMVALVVLLLGVLGSAAYRMKLYQEAYGLTELRLYVSVFMVWLTAVLGWLVATVLRNRRDRFVFGSLVAGCVAIAALHLLNPHAMIARVNIDRTAAGAEIDGSYLGTLGADAVPTLLARLDELPEAERGRVAAMLEERWQGDRRGGWRTWNLGDWRARLLVRAADGDAGGPRGEQ